MTSTARGCFAGFLEQDKRPPALAHFSSRFAINSHVRQEPRKTCPSNSLEQRELFARGTWRRESEYLSGHER